MSDDNSVPVTPPPTAPTPAPASPSRGRWLAAAAASIAIALFALPMLLGMPGGETTETPPPSGSTAACPAKSGDANLAFTVKDMNGASVRLADYKGKVIVLNFWATWCGPCKLEIPAFVELYDRYKANGLVILGVSGDDDAETLRAFASEWRMNYPVLVGRDHEDLMDAFGPLWGYPTTFMIGRDGSICGKHLGPATKEQFEREIKALL
jgi:cytochrome c biogenesis protein CcmG/thiol:disulfide interchange protein DsbE